MRIPKLLLSLVAIFALSRAVLYTLFPFRTDFLPWLNQLLDIELLKTNLWESVYYLHATPPLYNVYIGLVLQTSPEAVLPYTFAALHFFMGLGMVAMTYALLNYLTASPRLAFLGGLTLLAYPILFRFEIIPFYTYPIAFLLVLSAFLLMRFLKTNRGGYIVACLVVLLTLILFRNFFHVIVFFIPIAVGLCALVYARQRSFFTTAVIASAIVLAIGLVPSIRNYADYGVFSSSTWQGMQLFSMTHFVPDEKIDSLIAAGTVTPLARLPRFQNPDPYYAYYDLEPREGIPSLDNLYKSGGEQYGNFNNWIYIETAKEYQKDALAIITAYPQYLLPKLANSMYIFFGFAPYRYFDKADEWFIFDGGLLKQGYQAAKYFIEPALYALLFFSLFVGLRKTRDPLLLYLLFVLIYVFAVANIVELGENNTARVPIDPLVLILALYLFHDWLVRVLPRERKLL